MSVRTEPRRESAPVSRALTDPLPLTAVLAWLLTVSAIAVSAALGGTIPSPYSSTETVWDFFTAHRNAALASAVITFITAVPMMVLGGLLAQAVSRRGAPASAQFLTGAAAAAAGIALSAAGGGLWLLTRPEGTFEPNATHVLADAVFVLGGPVFAQAIGLLCLVTSLSLAESPVTRGMRAAGAVIGVVGLLAALGLVWQPLLLAMPIARFGGLGWLAAVGLVLAANPIHN